MSSLGDLRDKLLRGGLSNVSFLVVNERTPQSRAMYWEMRRRTAAGITVYQQAPLQDDVWELLEGDKDDFLIYDRCGQLTFHIVLPYSFLHYPYVEAAIRATYHKDICGNCSVSKAIESKTHHHHTHTHGEGPKSHHNHTEGPKSHNHHTHTHGEGPKTHHHHTHTITTHTPMGRGQRHIITTHTLINQN
uniref:Selenoprotein P2 n=1 Tax=Paramormyrops kingsleyae TaxID=1676925 RepID=A0A3B3SFQ2_9TELE